MARGSSAGAWGGGIILATNEQLYNFYQTQPQGLLSLAVSPLNTVMIKRLLKEEGWRRGGGVAVAVVVGGLELSRGATVVRRSARKESLSAFICHFLLPSWLH